jgi:hypothetical protein
VSAGATVHVEGIPTYNSSSYWRWTSNPF